MGVKKEVSDKDMGLDRIIKNLSELNRSVVKVGLFQDDRSSDGELSMAKLGHIQEKGADTGRTIIPERPFMENTALQYEYEIGNFMIDVIEGLTIGALSPKQALEKVGTEYEAFTKFTIDDFSDPTNAESTVEIKGFNDPLIHTGKMKSSVKFKVVRKR